MRYAILICYTKMQSGPYLPPGGFLVKSIRDYRNRVNRPVAALDPLPRNGVAAWPLPFSVEMSSYSL
jgi:hypothetical protein